jgi:hypothetical protein
VGQRRRRGQLSEEGSKLLESGEAEQARIEVSTANWLLPDRGIDLETFCGISHR